MKDGVNCQQCGMRAEVVSGSVPPSVPTMAKQGKTQEVRISHHHPVDFKPRPCLYLDISPSSGMPEFIPEIVDMIIDHLHDDKASLLTCSTVCRTWLPACRFHLFHTVTLNDILNKSLFGNFCSHLHNYTQIGPCVRELQVVGISGSPRCISLLDLGSLLAKLPNLHTLKLYSVMWNTSNNLSTECFTSQALRTLHISNTKLPSGVQAVLHIIELFPALEKFYMDYVYLPGQLSEVYGTLSDLPDSDLPDRRLRTVSMHASHLARPFLNYLQVTSSSRTLNTLSISSPPSDIEVLGCFLHDVGPQLRHLHLRFTFPSPCFHVSEGESWLLCSSDRPLMTYPSSEFWDNLGIPMCLDLESIRVFIPMRLCGEKTHGYSCYWRHILNLVRKLPTNIRKVEVGLHVEARKEDIYLKILMTAPWIDFGAAFSALGHLKAVRFEEEEYFFQDKCKELTPGVKKYIGKKLRALHKRRILYFGGQSYGRTRAL